MPGKKTDKEMYYITEIFTSSEGSPKAHGEKMEPAAGTFRPPGRRYSRMAYVNGKMIVRYVEEEISYMADYITNENGEIASVEYDPVPLSARERFFILKDEEEKLKLQRQISRLRKK